MCSNPKEHDSSDKHHTHGTTDVNQDSHPQVCSVPRCLNLCLRYQFITSLHVKATCLNFHTELFPVRSPLLMETNLVTIPPLTYMLKFNGFAELTSYRWTDYGMSHLQKPRMITQHNDQHKHTLARKTIAYSCARCTLSHILHDVQALNITLAHT